MRLGQRRLNMGAIAVLMAACGAGDPEGRTGPATWSLAGGPEVVIGVTEGAPEYLFHRIADAAFLADGRIVVADGGLGVVRVYAPDGSFQAEAGGTGDGPGEFRAIGTIAVQPPDTIHAYDPRAQRLNVFRADGTLVRTVPMAADEGYPELFLGRFDDGDLGLAWIRQQPRPASEVVPDLMQLARYSPDGEPRVRLGTGTGLRRFANGPVPFSPFFHGQVMGDSVYFTDGLRPEVVVVDRVGNRVRTIATPRSDAVPEAARRALDAELARRDRDGLRSRLPEVPVQDSVPHIADMFLDGQGRIWGKRYDPGTDALWLGDPGRGWGGEWWVLERDGRVAAEIALPSGVAPLEAHGDRLLGLRRTELGVEQVVVFRFGEGG